MRDAARGACRDNTRDHMHHCPSPPRRLVELYTNRALNRCTCVAGLLNSARPLLASLNALPAAFFRPIGAQHRRSIVLCCCPAVTRAGIAAGGGS